ncbi:type II secretion system F family protein [Limnoglobus roseus]|uniref:Pilus assembly protein TadB n=1 Tax=Limnoglobus roseus TaxID=2598579 RepID=A0A5C1A258_9BACT|nr:type II secretion system F family protein [Limnoglobus roseus]QEL13221.1 pilus assembly protein TadB [Limnoglobus roseus]
MSPLVLSVLIGALVIGAVLAVMLAFTGRDDGRATERLDMLVGRGSRKESSADLLLKQALMTVGDRKTVFDKLTPEFFNVTKMVEQADANIKPSALFGIGLGVGFVSSVMAIWMVNIYVAPVMFLLTFPLPFLWLSFKRKSRLNRFAAQLPDALELTARALRAGHSLAAGLHVVAEEMQAPIAKEFNRVYEEQNLGIQLEDALKNMTDRVPNLDLRFFITSVAIQRQTGGDLAEILDRIGYVIRERYKILGQVKALSAEGRLSGVVLIALPIGLFFLMLFMKPDYEKLLWTEPLGIKMSIGALIGLIVGAFVIKKIVDIKV